MKKLLLAILISLLPYATHAAIARDGGRAYGAASTATLTYNYTASTTGAYLLVCAAQVTDYTDVITGCTYNGTSMSLLKKEANGATNHVPTYMFGLANITAGAANVVCSASVSKALRSTAVSYTGVDSVDAISSTYAEGGDQNPTLTSTVDGAWYTQGYGVNGDWPTAIAGASIIPGSPGTNNVQCARWDSNGSVGAAGSHSFQYTGGTSFQVTSIDILLKPTTTTTVVQSILGLVRSFWLW